MCGAQAIPGVASSHRVLHLLLSLPTLPLSKSPLTWRTPLHYAACSGSVAAVEVVLKACVACACAAACAAACASQRATPTTPPQVHPRTPLQQHVLLHAGRSRSRTRQREGQAGRHAHCSGGDPGTPRRGEVSHGPRTLGAMVHASAATDAGLTVWCVVWCLLLCCLCLCTCAVYSCACTVLLCLCCLLVYLCCVPVHACWYCRVLMSAQPHSRATRRSCWPWHTATHVWRWTCLLHATQRLLPGRKVQAATATRPPRLRRHG